MKEERAFVGFSEAPINFAPTFKYDVLRSLKRIRRKQAKLDKNKKNGDSYRQLTEVEEKEIEELEQEEARAMEELNGEGASVISSAWTSVRSRVTGERDEDEDFYSSTSVQPVASSQSKSSIAKHAAQKAKAKWVALVSRSSTSIGHKASNTKRNRTSIRTKRPARNSMEGDPSRRRPVSPTLTDFSKRDPPSITMVSSHTKTSLVEDEDENFNKGVYDSSAKQRVPSW